MSDLPEDYEAAHAAVVADPDIPTDYDPETVAQLMREHGVEETVIKTVEHPEGITIKIGDVTA